MSEDELNKLDDALCTIADTADDMREFQAQKAKLQEMLVEAREILEEYVLNGNMSIPRARMLLFKLKS